MTTATKRPCFKASRFEIEIISKIVDRAMQMAETHGVDYPRIVAHMDLTACHNSCPLDLNRLLAVDDSNFAHDVFGIRRHMDRDTGKLGDCFVPRMALRQ